jgi:hypothetical protein
MRTNLDIWVLDFLAALSPQDRWKAASRLGSQSDSGRWLMAVGFVMLLVLVPLLVIVTCRRMAAERRLDKQLFSDEAHRRGLSPRERDTLVRIATLARLRQKSTVFNYELAFERGAAKLLQTSLAQHGAEQTETLRTELYCLSEKLGFKKDSFASAASPAALRGLTSRNIPAGRTVHLTRRKDRDSDNIEATVEENTNTELKVRTPMVVRVTLGESWRVRYYFGSSICEFDTTIVGSEGDIIILNHNESVRFINRRRFLRVPVNKPAFIASFPFEQPLSPHSGDEDAVWGPPNFVPAVVTELAGPGLRLEVPMELAVADRLVVVFRLSAEPTTPDLHEPEPDAACEQLEVVQDIGQVRHVKKTENGFSIAIELTGLSDSDLNQLIRATNCASLEAAQTNKSATPEPQKELAEVAVAQGNADDRNA